LLSLSHTFKLKGGTEDQDTEVTKTGIGEKMKKLPLLLKS
jgi:hypothetical protein